MLIKLKSLFILSALLLVVGCSATNGVGSKEYLVTQEVSEDASLHIFELVNSLDKGVANTITFEKGVYHFYPEKAAEKFCFISNHNDALTRIAFDLEGIDNLTIDGGGSTFVFHGIIIPFLVNHSNNLKLKNVSVDWAEPFHSEALVVANDKKAKTFDLSIPAQYPYEIRNGELYFVKPYYHHTMGQTIMYDADLNGIAFRTEDFTPITTTRSLGKRAAKANFEYPYFFDKDNPYIRVRGKESCTVATELKPGLVRISGHKKQMPLVGQIFTAKGEQGNNRMAPALKCNDSHNFVAENVVMHHAGGMGFLFENCEDVTLNKCKVTPSNGRMVSTTADASHFVGCRGKVQLLDCLFENQLDDAANIHGAYQEVVDVFEDGKLGIRVGHFQQQGFTLARPGDTIGMVRLAKSFDPYKVLTVKEIEFVNGRYSIISFNEELPEGIEKGDFLENLSAYPELLVRGCSFRGNRARGLLLSTPKKTVIENNYFATEMEALLIPVESSHWYESGSVMNLLVKGNTFDNSMIAGFNRGVIRLVTDDNNNNIAFKNITLDGNTFIHYDSWLIEASNVDGFTFENNTVESSDKFPALFPDNPAFTFRHSKNVNFANNTYNGIAKEMVKVSDDMHDIEFK